MKQKKLNKPTPLIHCSNPVSLVSRKIYNVLLWNVYKIDNELKQEEYSMDIDKLMDYCNISSQNRHYIKQLCKNGKELTSTIVEWNINREDKKNNWGCSSLLGSIEIIDNQIFYTIPKPLRRLIKDYKIYGKINLNISKLFKSKYTYSLYEILSRYKKVNSTGYIELNEIRNYLGVIDTYKNYNDFKKHILKKALNEINEKSELIVNIEEKKYKKSITHIKFLIKEKNENPLDFNQIKNDTSNIKNNYQNNNFSNNEEHIEKQKEKLQELKDKLKDNNQQN